MALAYDELICVAAAFDASLGPSIRSSLRREWLSDSMNARCFDVAHTLEAAGTPPTFVSAAAWLQAHQQTDAICYLLENVEPCMVLASDVQGALERLREIHATRELAALAGRMDAFQQRNPGATADELRIYLESQLAGISTASTAAGVNVMDAVDAACQQMIDLARAEAYGVGDRPGLWFGVHELDLHMGGLFPGQVCIIAARPGVGKSSLAGQFCIEQAFAGKRGLFFSYEMSVDELVQRMVRQCFPDDCLLNHLEDNIGRARRKLDSLPGTVIIHDNPMTNDRQIRAVARQEQAAHGLDYVVIDYVQLIPAADRNENRQQEVTAISASLKATAKLLGVPLIVLSQFSRAAVESGEPMLHHLRESGSLEQDADKCLLMWEPREKDRTDDPRRFIKAKWAKNRQGPVGSCELCFVPARFLFTGDPGWTAGRA